MRALAIIDGEHYLSTVTDALEELPYEFVAALVGGSEKLRGGEDYGLPLVDSLAAALEHDLEVVVDLSDEPVLGRPTGFAQAERSRSASRMSAPTFASTRRRSSRSSCRRSGSSAPASASGRRPRRPRGSRARRAVRRRRRRHGPRWAGGARREAPPTIDDLLALSRSGRHAASDCLEDAALAGVVTIGCRRAGGGLAGAPFVSNVHEGAALAAERAPASSSSRAAARRFPPIDTSKRVLVVGGGQSPEVAAGYLNAYRVLVSDLVLVIGGGASLAAIRGLTDVPVLEARLRPRPAESVEGPVAVFTTAPADAREAIARS